MSQSVHPTTNAHNEMQIIHLKKKLLHVSASRCHPQQDKPNRWHNDEQAAELIQYTYILFYGG
jgi:hypothetical protein